MKATRRDLAVVEAVAEGRYLSREQIQELFFRGMSAPTKCQERLRKLTRAKQLKRKRLADGFVYYYDKWSEKAGHWIAMNWVYTAMVTQAKSWHKISVFRREYVYGDLRADALIAIDNTVKCSRQVYFLEVDNGTNPFTEKYGALAESLHYALEQPWWMQGGFPPVLVVTTRPEKVREIVASSAVRYQVVTMEQVRKDVFACLNGAR